MTRFIRPATLIKMEWQLILAGFIILVILYIIFGFGGGEADCGCGCGGAKKRLTKLGIMRGARRGRGGGRRRSRSSAGETPVADDENTIMPIEEVPADVTILPVDDGEPILNPHNDMQILPEHSNMIQENKPTRLPETEIVSAAEDFQAKPGKWIKRTRAIY